MNIVPQEFVAVVSGAPMTDTHAVARHFDKPHKNVIRDVRTLVNQLPESAKLNFELCYEISTLQNGKRQPFYRMTKDAFMLLAMGFTGAKALAMKLAFIEAFNRMAEFIRTQAAEQWQRHVEAIERRAAETAIASMHGRGLARFGRIKPDLYLQVERSRPYQFALAFGP